MQTRLVKGRGESLDQVPMPFTGQAGLGAREKLDLCWRPGESFNLMRTCRKMVGGSLHIKGSVVAWSLVIGLYLWAHAQRLCDGHTFIIHD